MSTYNYETGKITRDFKFRRTGERCKLGGLPAKVGNDFCLRCKHNCGTQMDWTARDLEDLSFTKCNHPEAKDSENTESVKYTWYERFEQEALQHYYD